MTDYPTRPFAAAEIRPLGISRHQLDRAVEDGLVRRVVRGVYLRADAPDDLETRLQAVSIALRPGQVVSDRTAAWLHGIDLFQYAEHEVGLPIETCALRGEPRSRLSGVDGRTRDLKPEDVLLWHGIPVTTPLRTAADLGCNLYRRDALAALDQFGRVHEVSREELEQLFPRFRGRRGVVQFRNLVPLVDLRAESTRESWTRLALHDAGLPPPVPQFWILVDGYPTYRLDLAYPASRAAIEYDGEEFHSTPADRAADRDRRQWLRDRGWTVVIVRNGDFTSPRLEQWIGRVRRALQPPTNRRF